MVPRISVVAKISIRKKPLAMNGMIRRITATSQTAGLLNSGHASKVARAALPADWSLDARPGPTTCQRLASRPCGRSASTSTMMRKVTTIA